MTRSKAYTKQQIERTLDDNVCQHFFGRKASFQLVYSIFESAALLRVAYKKMLLYQKMLPT